MAFRFFRRLKLAPGVTLNLTKRGGSLSFGPRGAKITAGTSGVRRTVSVPGTGLWYTEKVGGGKSSRRGRSRGGRDDGAPPTPTVRPEDRLNLGFFKRLFTPQNERAFVDGMRYVVTGDEGEAYTHLRRAAPIADAAFMTGTLALKFERYADAEAALARARRHRARLGTYFAKYGIDAVVTLGITERISAQIGPTPRGVLLALAEVHQAQGNWRQAVRDLRELHRHEPSDAVVLLSLVEMLVEEAGDKRACREVVELTSDVDNRSEVQAAILLWKGKALAQLGLHTAARDTLTAALRRKKDRSDELLQAIRYERALVYEKLGQRRRSRGELEKLYAEAPDYEDVAERLFEPAGSG